MAFMNDSPFQKQILFWNGLSNKGTVLGAPLWIVVI